MAQTKQRGEAVLRAIDRHWGLRHGLFWLVQTALMTWMLVYGCPKGTTLGTGLRYALQWLVLHAVVTYALLYGVLPVLWQANGKRFGWWVAGWILLSLSLSFAFRYFIHVQAQLWGVRYLTDDAHFLSSGPCLPVLGTAVVAASLRLYRHWRHQQWANAQLTQENYRAKLQLLKAQIHPHFLFNTLNTLYALTLKQSDRASEVVGRLTGLLQFVVEQGNAPLVTLPQEVALLRNYLALEHLRYGNRLTLHFEANDLPATGGIAPLLLLPLVENAFKHGAAEQLGPAHIDIALAANDGWFTCVIQNTKSADPTAVTGAPGIGLRNVQQRLHLLYPQRHRFHVEEQADTYTVRLALLLLPVPAASVRRRAARASSHQRRTPQVTEAAELPVSMQS